MSSRKSWEINGKIKALDYLGWGKKDNWSVWYYTHHRGRKNSENGKHYTIVSRGGWFGSSLSFKMTQWSCYCIGESACYWLEKGNSMDTWRRRTHNTWRWRTTLIKSERCYWITASLYSKYNTFSDRESEQQHRTMTFAELPNHPLLLTMITHTNA